MIYNKKAETMDRGSLEQLQIERVQATLNRVYRNVAFYKRLLDGHGITVDRVRSLADLQALPFTTKADLRNAYPYDMFAVPLRDIVRIHLSSGTTGRRVVVGYTRNDIAGWTELMARCLTAAGVTAHDLVQVAHNYGLFTGGLGFHYGAEKIEASVIPTSSTGNLQEQILIMKDFKTTALVTTPGAALSIAHLVEGMAIPPAEMFLRVAILGAEPWSETVRTQIQEKLRVRAFDCYGVSELIGPGVACECSECNGLHVNEDHFILEVIQPNSDLPCRAGEEGELVFTSIVKEGFPLVRYRTGDLGSLLEGPCACGRTFVRMSRVAGRTDDLMIVRGVKVLPSQVQEVLLAGGNVGPRMRIVLGRKDDVDTMEVVLAPRENLPFIDQVRSIEQLRDELAQAVEEALGIRPLVTFVEPATLETDAGEKNLRVIDNRPR